MRIRKVLHTNRQTTETKLNNVCISFDIETMIGRWQMTWFTCTNFKSQTYVHLYVRARSTSPSIFANIVKETALHWIPAAAACATGEQVKFATTQVTMTALAIYKHLCMHVWSCTQKYWPPLFIRSILYLFTFLFLLQQGNICLNCSYHI